MRSSAPSIGRHARRLQGRYSKNFHTMRVRVAIHFAEKADRILFAAHYTVRAAGAEAFLLINLSVNRRKPFKA
jgi:hypothetical protein